MHHLAGDMRRRPSRAPASLSVALRGCAHRSAIWVIPHIPLAPQRPVQRPERVFAGCTRKTTELALLAQYTRPRARFALDPRRYLQVMSVSPQRAVQVARRCRSSASPKPSAWTSRKSSSRARVVPDMLWPCVLSIFISNLGDRHD